VARRAAVGRQLSRRHSWSGSQPDNPGSIAGVPIRSRQAVDNAAPSDPIPGSTHWRTGASCKHSDEDQTWHQNPRLQQLHESGVSIWLNTLSRDLLETGGFAELIGGYSVTGATPNPTIFANAIEGSSLYDDQLRGLAAAGRDDTQELFFSIAFEDVRDAAEHLCRENDRTGGTDGFISFECTPDLADETDATIAQAIDLCQRIDRRTVLIKVPGTEAGLPAIEELTRRGVNVKRRVAVFDRALRAGDDASMLWPGCSRPSRRAGRLDHLGRVVFHAYDLLARGLYDRLGYEMVGSSRTVRREARRAGTARSCEAASNNGPKCS
jgi:hypothetical protein